MMDSHPCLHRPNGKSNRLSFLFQIHRFQNNHVLSDQTNCCLWNYNNQKSQQKALRQQYHLHFYIELVVLSLFGSHIWHYHAYNLPLPLQFHLTMPLRPPFLWPSILLILIGFSHNVAYGHRKTVCHGHYSHRQTLLPKALSNLSALAVTPKSGFTTATSFPFLS